MRSVHAFPNTSLKIIQTKH